MPHLRIEYSTNIADRFDPAAVLAAVTDALVASGVFDPPEAVKNHTQDAKSKADTIARFIAEECRVAPGLQVSFTTLKTAYRGWAASTGVEPEPESTFAKTLGALGFEAAHDRMGRYRCGLALIHPPTPEDLKQRTGAVDPAEMVRTADHIFRA